MRLAVLIVSVLCLACGGCATFSDATQVMRERIAGTDDSRTRAYTATQRATFEAARETVMEMGYRIVRSAAAQGELAAISGVRRGETGVGAQQLSLKAGFDSTLDGGTQVTVRITEILEDDPRDRPGMATETPLRDTPQYEVFFRGIQERIGSQPSDKP